MTLDVPLLFVAFCDDACEVFFVFCDVFFVLCDVWVPGLPFCCASAVVVVVVLLGEALDEVLLSPAAEGGCIAVLLSPWPVFKDCAVVLARCGDEFVVFFEGCAVPFVCEGCGLLLVVVAEDVGVEEATRDDPSLPLVFMGVCSFPGVCLELLTPADPPEPLGGALGWLWVGVLAPAEVVVAGEEEEEVDAVAEEEDSTFLLSTFLLSFGVWLLLGLSVRLLEEEEEGGSRVFCSCGTCS